MDSFLSTIDTIFKTATEPFATPAVIILDKTYDLTSWLGEPSFGLAIIILAVTVAAALYPFRYVQYQATDSVVKLFTLHKERMAIIRKHKDDEKAMLAELDALHEKHNIKPLRDCAAGFIPIFVQIPVCIGIYSGLRYYPMPPDTSFLTLSSLTQADAGWTITAFIFLRFLCYRFLTWHRTNKVGGRFSWGADTYILITAIISAQVLSAGLWLYMLSSSFIGMMMGEWLWRTSKRKERKILQKLPQKS